MELGYFVVKVAWS